MRPIYGTRHSSPRFESAAHAAQQPPRIGEKNAWFRTRSGQEALGVRGARLELLDAEDQARLVETQARELRRRQRRGGLAGVRRMLHAADLHQQQRELALEALQFLRGRLA